MLALLPFSSTLQDDDHLLYPSRVRVLQCCRDMSIDRRRTWVLLLRIASDCWGKSNAWNEESWASFARSSRPLNSQATISRRQERQVAFTLVLMRPISSRNVLSSMVGLLAQHWDF